MSHVSGEVQMKPWVPKLSLVRHGTVPYGVPPGEFASTDS